jgi:hypothetical protein
MEFGANEKHGLGESRESGLGDGSVIEHRDGAGRSAEDMASDSQDLRRLAGKLESRGMRSRLVTYSGGPGEEHVEQIVVTNPAAPERGEVRVSDDGAVTWEFFGDLGEPGAGRILDEVTNALRATGLPLRRQAAMQVADLAGTAEQQLVYLNTHWGRSYRFTAPAGPDEEWKAKARFGAQDDLSDFSPAGLLAKVHDHSQTRRREDS